MPEFTKWQEPYFVNKVGNFLRTWAISILKLLHEGPQYGLFNPVIPTQIRRPNP